MGTKLQPRKFQLVACNRQCSLNAYSLPGDVGALIHSWYEMGDNNSTIVAKARVLDVKISEGAVGRHRANHLVPLGPTLSDPRKPDGGSEHTGPRPKIDDLTVLEQIISKGADSIDLSTVRISPEMTIRAIELKYKLTQGSVLENFMSALGETMETSMKADDPGVAAEEEVAQSAEEIPVADE
jgi:hypothetical protein